eukprot:693358_1
MAFNWNFSGTDLQNNEDVNNNIISSFAGFTFGNTTPPPNQGETNALPSEDNPDAKYHDNQDTFRFEFNPQQSRSNSNSNHNLDDTKYKSSFEFGTVNSNKKLSWKPPFHNGKCDWRPPFNPQPYTERPEPPPLIRIVVSEKLVSGYIRNIDTKRPDVPMELVHLSLQFTQLIGTKHIVFNPLSEPKYPGIRSATQLVYYQHLSALPELTHVSVEELRYEDLYNVPAVDHNVAEIHKLIQIGRLAPQPPKQPPKDMRPQSNDNPFIFNADHKNPVLNSNGTNENQNDSFFDSLNTCMDRYSQMKKQLNDCQSQLRNADTRIDILKRQNAVLKKQNTIYELEVNELKAKYGHSNDHSTWNWGNTHQDDSSEMPEWNWISNTTSNNGANVNSTVDRSTSRNTGSWSFNPTSK